MGLGTRPSVIAKESIRRQVQVEQCGEYFHSGSMLKPKNKGGFSLRVRCGKQQFSFASGHFESYGDNHRMEETAELMSYLDRTQPDTPEDGIPVALSYVDLVKVAGVRMVTGDLNYRDLVDEHGVISDPLVGKGDRPGSHFALHGLQFVERDMANTSSPPTYMAKNKKISDGTSEDFSDAWKNAHKKDKKRKAIGYSYTKGGVLDRTGIGGQVSDRADTIVPLSQSDHSASITCFSIAKEQSDFLRVRDFVLAALSVDAFNCGELCCLILTMQENELNKILLTEIYNYYRLVREVFLKAEASRLKGKSEEANELKQVAEKLSQDGKNYFITTIQTPGQHDEAKTMFHSSLQETLTKAEAKPILQKKIGWIQKIFIAFCRRKTITKELIEGADSTFKKLGSLFKIDDDKGSVIKKPVERVRSQSLGAANDNGGEAEKKLTAESSRVRQSRDRSASEPVIPTHRRNRR